jgi:hypothetical protein
VDAGAVDFCGGNLESFALLGADGEAWDGEVALVLECEVEFKGLVEVVVIGCRD